MKSNCSVFYSRKRKRSLKNGNLICDRTSELPQVILQHILSFLPVTEAARTSILSKTWSQAWFSRPNLNFDQSSFLKENPDDDPPNFRFLRFVVRTLKRYLQHNISVQDLTFSVDMLDAELASHFDLLIEAAMLIRVKHLHISIENISASTLQLIQKILAAKQLKSLCIKGCRSTNDEPRVVCGGVSTINCTSLQSLILCHVELDENEIHNLFSGCPLIESLILEGCMGMKKIKVQGKFPHLKQFEITELKSEMDEVSINAPSLESFIYKIHKKGIRRDCVLRIKLAAPNLKRLQLSKASISNEYLDDLLLCSPLLEDLRLEYCYKLDRIYVSSLSLRRFSLLFCINLLEVNLNAPSLLLFKFHGHHMIPTITCKRSIPMEGRLTMAVSNSNATSLLLKLRDIISKVKHSWITVVMFHEGTNVEVNHEDLRALPIPLGHQVKELWLDNFSFSPVTYEALVEGLLWACQPKKFKMSSKIDGDIDFVNSLVQKLMAKREDVSCSCSCKDDDQVKCRRHYFTDFRIKSFQSNHRTNRFCGTFKFSRCRS